MRIVGALGGIFWGVRFLIIGACPCHGLGDWIVGGWSVNLCMCDRFDPSGFIVEHYVDGDLADESYPVNRSLASPDNLHVWGMSPILMVPFLRWVFGIL